MEEKKLNKPIEKKRIWHGKRQSKKGQPEPALKVIPIGGLNEIGKNLTLLECDGDILIIDCGMSFPDDEMFGIDSVLPDYSYLYDNRERVKGLIITHGHEDHIGGIPYLLKELQMPVYGSKLSCGMVDSKLKEFSLQGDLRVISAGDRFQVGCFGVEAIRTTHSISDAFAFAIDTPVGKVFHSGDFKVDYTPLEGEPLDLQRLAEIGQEGVLLMMADSTNAERKGFTPSEQIVGATLDSIFRSREGRIIVASFSSNIQRIQTIIDTAVTYNRKVALSGRSMVNVVNLAMELGYLHVPPETLVDINKTKNLTNRELVIITTGSQGEPMSALTRMASNEHRSVQIQKGDVVILSSNPIPGNERTVSNIINNLFEKGAEVIYSAIAPVHVSGHACEEELKLLHSLIRPKFFVPVHGEYRHLIRHGAIAESLGMEKERVQIMENGQVLEVRKSKMQLSRETVPCEPVLVDGFGVGDVGSVVLKDRKILSASGLIVVVAAIDKASGQIVSGPEIISRGFVYVKENEDMMAYARELVADALENRSKNDWNAMKSLTRDVLRSYIYQETGRSPMILPLFLEV